MQKRLGRYLLLHPLAQGGMGELFISEHTGLSGFAKRVVLKRIKPELARQKRYVELFLNEARVGSFLNHPNIVHIFDVGHEDDQLWLVMEYVEGVDLKRLVRRTFLAKQPLLPEALATIFVQVLDALEEAHKGGPAMGEPIIHRDLSPENILITPTGTIKVLDFGLAKWVPGQESVPSLEGKQIIGKTRYMPPEQLHGQNVDARSDLFSLGVVFYEALTNALPFGTGTALETATNILSGPPPALTIFNPRVPPALEKIIEKSLQPKPDRRFQSAAEMRDALISYIENTGTAMPLGTIRKLLNPGANSKKTKNPESISFDGTPTEVSLAVAKRCGKCGGEFCAHLYMGTLLDLCLRCEGIWLDFGEVQRLLGEIRTFGKHQEPKLSESVDLDRVVGSCPQCRIGLKPYAVPNHNVSFEICPKCYGVWLDRDEIRLFRNQDVVTWFRILLDSIVNLPAQY
ncbi:MAG: protein kinase [Myxococcota bacterium]|nr:protein kinase [Myxococcota bacterium]